MENILLNNGVEMPMLGYGLYKVDPTEGERCVSDAIQIGYRLIDTAPLYANEQAVGNAVASSGIRREDFFIVTKVWISQAGEDKAEKSIEESLKKLKTDYVDLLLVHQPFGDYYGTYRTLQRALEDGRCRAIGISNFYKERFLDIVAGVDVMPAVNQLETNVFCQQTRSREMAAVHGVKVMAWAPMAQGKDNFFNHEVLTVIGQKYGKTACQTGLRFLMQEGIPAIPKSSSYERMKENFEIFDFNLDESDMKTLRGLNRYDSGTRDYTDVDYARSLIERKY